MAIKSKPQIFLIHGGNTFRKQKEYLHYLKTRKVSLKSKSLGWAQNYLDKELGKKFQIIRPRMPLQDNAKYNEWKIVFESYFPYLKNNIILIGNSLGGIFLAKYLSENKFPKKILSTFLVCAPYDNTMDCEEELVGGFKLKSDLSKLDKSSKNLYFMFSKDDPVVPVAHAEKYRKKLKNAKILVYKNKNGHFFVPKFPEIVKLIKSDYKNK